MTLILYCLAIAVGSLAGGYLPLSQRVTHINLQVYLSLSGGAMLGAAFFHMLPHSAELAPRQFGVWMALGVIGLYVIERFLSPHSHDTDGLAGHHHEREARPQAAAEDSHRLEPPAAPMVAGGSAVAGLSIHTLLGGIALGSAVLGESQISGLGLAVFLATLLHKPADALTISTLLLKGGAHKARVWMVQACFACLIPLGAALFYLGQSAWTARLETAFTGCVLAFSAGTFVCIALSDLLPEVQFHSHDRGRLFLAVIAGAGLMWATSLIEPAEGPRPAGAPRGRMMFPERPMVGQINARSHQNCAADVAWASPECMGELGNRAGFPRAPEICVEVLSPANTDAEIREKTALYFDAGAQEVWICGGSGAMKSLAAALARPLRNSRLCPQFPKRVELP